MGLINAVNCILLFIAPVFCFARVWALPTVALVGLTALAAAGEVVQAAVALPLNVQAAAVPPLLAYAIFTTPQLRRAAALGGNLANTADRPKAVTIGMAMGFAFVHLVSRVSGALGSPGFSWEGVVLGLVFHAALLRCYAVVSLASSAAASKKAHGLVEAWAPPPTTLLITIAVGAAAKVGADVAAAAVPAPWGQLVSEAAMAVALFVFSRVAA
jgi:hypothetical protein